MHDSSADLWTHHSLLMDSSFISFSLAVRAADRGEKEIEDDESFMIFPAVTKKMEEEIVCNRW